MKDTVIWNTEQGLALSALDVSRAQAERAALFYRVQEFFERFDFLLLPVSQVLPFPMETDWVREINGIEMQTYVDWMMSCSFITLTEHPGDVHAVWVYARRAAGGCADRRTLPRRARAAEAGHAFEQQTHAPSAPTIALRGASDKRLVTDRWGTA